LQKEYEMKRYYLSKLVFIHSVLEEEIRVTQLVYASNEDNAREAVRREALDNIGIFDSNIMEIRINDTIIGD